MVVLKKVKASTLMETLVATVLIVVIFMLASMILNSLFSSTLKNNTSQVQTYLYELEYQNQTGLLQLPYQEDYNNWLISIENIKENNQQFVEIEAVNKDLNKTIIKRLIEAP